MAGEQVSSGEEDLLSRVREAVEQGAIGVSPNGDSIADRIRRLEERRRAAKVADTAARRQARRYRRVLAELTAARPSNLLGLLGRVWRQARTPSRLPDETDLTELETELSAFRLRQEALRPLPTGPDAGLRVRAALAVSAELIRDEPGHLDVLRRRVEALEAVGEVSSAYAYVELVAPATHDRWWRDRRQYLEGIVTHTDIDWTPAVHTPTRRLETVSGRVLDLVKESRPYHERGYTMRTATLLETQRAAGYEPVVVTGLGFPRDDGFAEFSGVEDVDGVRHHRLDLGPAYSRVTTPASDYVADWVWRATSVVERERPALIHAGSGHHGFDTALVGLALARHYDIPFVYEVRSALEHTWTAVPEFAESGELFERRLAQENRCAAAADAVFVICEAVREDLLGRGIDADKIFTLPNVVDRTTFSTMPRNEPLRAELGLTGSFVVGYISNLGRREGLDVLIRAAAIAAPDLEDLHVLIVGDGPERDRLEALARDLGVADRVTLLGPVPHDRIADHYSVLDLFVVPRRHDRASQLITPLKPFEAMAVGVPIVVADQPALLEIADPPTRGRTFVTEDPGDLAAVIAELAGDDQQRRELAATAAEWIDRERRLEHNVARLAAGYQYAFGTSA